MNQFNAMRILFNEDDICNRTPEVINALTTIIAQSYSGSSRIQDIESIVVANWHVSRARSIIYVNNSLDILEIRYAIKNSAQIKNNFYDMQNARCYISQFTDVYKQSIRQQKLKQLL